LSYLLFIATLLFVFGNRQANYAIYLTRGLQRIDAGYQFPRPELHVAGLLPDAGLLVPDQRPAQCALQLEPMTHHIDIFRSPVIFNIIPLHSWLIYSVATVLLWVVALAMLGLYRKRIVFFL
jgi:hypothetical protein